jgi:hypothetical protein
VVEGGLCRPRLPNPRLQRTRDARSPELATEYTQEISA